MATEKRRHKRRKAQTTRRGRRAHNIPCKRNDKIHERNEITKRSENRERRSKGRRGETYDGKKREEEGKEQEEEQEEKTEAAPPNEEKDDEREERTKLNPTILVNDGRTDLNESGK
jgi:hypothetical protein